MGAGRLPGGHTVRVTDPDPLTGPCGACGKTADLSIATSPLNAPASVALCPDCFDARTLPLSFLLARVEFADHIDLRDFQDQAERFGFTVLIDGERKPLAPFMTEDGVTRLRAATPST